MSEQTKVKPVWVTPAVLAVVALIVGVGIRVLVSAPRSTSDEAAADRMRDASANGSVTPAHGPGADSGAPDLEPGPDGTVRIGNATCPVMGNPVSSDVGVAFNGWWISFCCDGCDDRFLNDPDAYAANLLEQTGHDVRQKPGGTATLPFEPGPDGTHRLGNKVCPVMGNPAKPDVGIAFNGWWVTFCCDGCDKAFADDPGAYVPVLLDETGIDVRRSPQQTAARPEWAEGPNGTRDVANATCPVSNAPVRGDVGVEVNGWWVRVCSPACASVFVTHLVRYAPRLRETAGVDVRFGADHQPERGSPLREGDDLVPPIDDAAVRPATSGEPGDLPNLISDHCPVTGNPASPDYIALHNGWVIGFCSAGCQRQFMADPDAWVDALRRMTGHDIRFGPAEQPPAVPADSQPALPGLPPGPDGTVRLGNGTCPVMGNPTKPTNDTGVAVSGWWVSFCCPMCKQRFLDDLDRYAGVLLQQTGHDVRRQPR